MSDDGRLDRAARSWLESGPTRAPDHAIKSALLEIQSTPQERDWHVPRRTPTMNLRNAIAVVAVVAVVALGAATLGRLGSTSSVIGTLPSPSLTPTLSAAPTSTGSRTPTATPAPSFVPVGDLTQAYVSDLYGYKLHYPATWKLTPGTSPGLPESVPSDISVDSSRIDFYADTVGNGHGLMVTSGPLSATRKDLAAWTAFVDDRVRRTFGTYLRIAACVQSTRTLVLDRAPANEVDYICPDHDWLWVTAVHAGRAYQVAWLDDGGFDSASLRPLLDKFLKTFAFTG